MTKGLVRKMMVGAAVATAIAGLTLTENVINTALSTLWNSISYVDHENPMGRETCYLSETDAGLSVTTRDVSCRQVVYVDEKNKSLREPIIPQRVQDNCEYPFQRGENGSCEYFPPKP